MKAFLLLIATTLIGTQLKAQAPSTFIKPVPKIDLPPMTFKADTSYLKKLDKSDIFKIPDQSELNPQQFLAQSGVNNGNHIIINDRMPRVTTSNIDHMPIVRTDEPGMKYTMKIKRVDINPVTVADTAKARP